MPHSCDPGPEPLCPGLFVYIYSDILYKLSVALPEVDRSRSGLPGTILNGREFSARFPGNEIKLRLLLDRYSLELFVNDGEQAATFVVFSPEAADGISFSAEGSLLLDVDKYDLELS